MIAADAGYILLDDRHAGQLTLQASANEQAKKTAFLFKVKCNILEAVQTKPSHGLILSNNKVTLRVRYKGALAEISTVKLKGAVVQRIFELLEQSLTQDIENDLGHSINMCQTLGFCLMKNQHMPYSKDSTQGQSVQTRNSLKTLYDLLGQRGAVLTRTDKEKTMIDRTSTLGLRQLLFYSILAFLLGVSFGIKLSRMQ